MTWQAFRAFFRVLCGINPDKALNRVYSRNFPYNTPLTGLKRPFSVVSRFYYGIIPYNHLLKECYAEFLNAHADKTIPHPC
jgi:hypothetical protein